MSRRKRKRKLRLKRLFICLLIFIIFIFLIIFLVKSLINYRKYKSIKETGTVTIYSNKINLWNKTIKYTQDNLDYIKIKHKNYIITLNSKYFKNNLDLDINIYNKRINEPLFDNIKSVYVDKSKLLNKTSTIEVKLPKYLYKNKVVDIYGYNNENGNVLLYPKLDVKNKYVKFNINKIYDEYFITYIKAKSISAMNNINIEVGDNYNLNVKAVPNNSTFKDFKYKYDKKYLSINNGVIKAKKIGKTNINIYSPHNKISKDISINIKNKTKKVSKEIKKEENDEKKLVVKNGITYVDGIMIVNKSYSLPSTYNPGGLTDEFMNAFTKMQDAALLDNINLFVASGFRDYDYQVELYNKYVETDGKKAADTYSARPGFSEHQTGLAADINAADSSFDNTKEAKWLHDNCYKYGFVIRFPKGKEKYTGYVYESWHLRYVGEKIAKKIHDAGDNISLEEYYHLKSEYKD